MWHTKVCNGGSVNNRGEYRRQEKSVSDSGFTMGLIEQRVAKSLLFNKLSEIKTIKNPA
jgi:hypothetical protein